MEDKKALVFGATGLIGNYLLQQLLHSNLYSSVVVFVRKPLGIEHPKLTQVIFNFDEMQNSAEQIHGSDLFFCLGSTMKKAKTKENFRKVDYSYALQIAEIAKQNQVNGFHIISSIGASAKSSNFYLRVKGETERDIAKLNFRIFTILRPSILVGDRKEFRLAEKIGIGIMKIIGFAFIGSLRKYKAIHGKTVASAMIQFAQTNTSFKIAESDEIEKVGKNFSF